MANRKRVATSAVPAATTAVPVGPKSGVRVRMYRVGVGDFFLLTVPGRQGPAHILIDCGVDAGDIHSMDDCVKDLKKETNNRLALVILTHYHAGNMSGFASNYDDFAQFEVGAVWITNRLDPNDAEAKRSMDGLRKLAMQLRMHLGARDDETGRQARRTVDNALGNGAGGRDGGNARALQLLQAGFKGNPPVFYFEAGDLPTLPADLDGMMTAEILGPAPRDSQGEFAARDRRSEQVLAAAGEYGISHWASVHPFEKAWPATSADYPATSFDEFDSGLAGPARERKGDGIDRMREVLQAMRPDAMAAAADALDDTLNHQSLVVLFTCQGKRLLFVGDAQWGSWADWLDGKGVNGQDPGISERARQIRGSLDFYTAAGHAPDPQARRQSPALPAGFTTPGQLYIDYEL